MKKIFYILISTAFLCSCSNKKYTHNHGLVFGTSFNTSYQSNINLDTAIARVLADYDASVSTFNQKSLISRINRNESYKVNDYFTAVFNAAKDFYTKSDGLFDVTIQPLSNHWKFSDDRPDTISMDTYHNIVAGIDSVREFVGMNKVNIVDGEIVKDDPRIQLEMCAIAEGYGIDLAAKVLDDYGVENYLVEIGGELHVKGVNEKGNPWVVSIDKPVEGSTVFNRDEQHRIAVTDCAISTSGSYRQYYYREDGVRFSHTINPSTGEPVTHNTISITTVGPNTMSTDAWATICMVAGYPKALDLLNNAPGIEGLIIYQDEDGLIQEAMTDGFKKLIIK